MNKLLPPNATVLEQRLAEANAPLGAIPVTLDTLMDPDRIPLAFLPWLAWHMGGYGLYVWGSFGAVVLVVGGELWSLRTRRKALHLEDLE